MASRPKTRNVSLLVVGILLGSLLVTPAGAHVGGTVGHLWTRHIRPLAKQIFYTKTQANNRFYTKTQANNRFQQKCKSGAVLAFAYVNGASLSGAGFTQTGVSRQYNCAGGPITGRRAAAGVYELRIPGIKASVGGVDDGLVATLSPTNHSWTVMNHDVHTVDDYIEIWSQRPDTSAFQDTPFVITVYRAP